MRALLVALAGAAVLLNTQAVNAQQYTVWASVIFSRTGERTPEVLGYIPTTLTSFGANQAYESGVFFRNRYVSSANQSMTPDVAESAPLQGLNANSVDGLQTYVIALDEQYCVASAQAFMQGLYPPATLSNSGDVTQLEATSVLANGSYINYPLQGYQYAQVHAAGAMDPDFPYIGGSLDCPALDASASFYTQSPQFAATENESSAIYQAVGPPMLNDVLPENGWDYYNAYAIFDYLNYQMEHNATVATELARPNFIDPLTNISYFDSMRFYADQQQYAELGNLSAYNNNTDSNSLPYGITGSISTIAGNLLAAKMLAQLQIAVETGGEFYQLSLLFGDFEPLVSFFAIAGLPQLDSNFYGLPNFGSAAVFEVFSYSNDSTADAAWPDTDQLYVQFLFRNGTDDSDELQAYPLFNRGPSETQMSWSDFQDAMTAVSLGDIGDWCLQCGASGNLFCAAWNSSDAVSGSSGDDDDNNDNSSVRLSPAAAGAIGAVVTLVVAGLVFAAIILLGGYRMHKVERRKKGEMGGFKGSQKLASDRDLTIPKGGAVVGASVEHESPISPMGHERVGSWELNQKEIEVPNIAGAAEGEHRSSMEDEYRVDPFQDPVKPDERV